MSVRYEIIACEQGTPEWFEARLGMPTASRFKDVMARGDLKMRSKYLRQLAGEIMTGEPMETYTNPKMERGREQEHDLRLRYASEYEVDVAQIGFMKMNPQLCRTGCSPDGLIGDDGMIEIKSAEPHVLIEYLQGKSLYDHMHQVMGQLWISGRKWCDLVIGYPKMPLCVTRVERIDTSIAGLAGEIKAFNRDLDELVTVLRRL